MPTSSRLGGEGKAAYPTGSSTDRNILVVAFFMKPSLRKLTLTAHVAFSVGWLGAVAGFLALAIAGLVGHDDQRVRAAYLAMEMIGWFVIVPCSLAALMTGLIQALGTGWGLFRHYWVLVKLLSTILATVFLLVHMQLTSRIAGVAADLTASTANLGGLRIQLVGDAGAALVLLVAVTALSVYKPWGRIRDQQPRPAHLDPAGVHRGPAGSIHWGRYVLLGFIALVLLVIALHLVGGLGHH